MSDPVFDSRNDELPYYVTTKVNGVVADFRKRMHDPFHHTVVSTRFGWWDRLRILAGMPVTVQVCVEAEPEVVEAVCELDANYRGKAGSTRRAEYDERIRAALSRTARTGCY
jgi:hypothetical protein